METSMILGVRRWAAGAAMLAGIAGAAERPWLSQGGRPAFQADFAKRMAWCAG